MPRFIFKLDGVLEHRKHIERQKQRELALIQVQMQQLQTALRQLDQSMQEAAGDLRRNRLVGQLDMAFLAAHRRFTTAVQRQAMGLVQKMALVQKQTEEARRALAEAAKQRKIIEKLREKQFDRWLADMNKREVDQLDEIGMQLSFRQLKEQLAETEPGGAA